MTEASNSRVILDKPHESWQERTRKAGSNPLFMSVCHELHGQFEQMQHTYDALNTALHALNLDFSSQPVYRAQFKFPLEAALESQPLGASEQYYHAMSWLKDYFANKCLSLSGFMSSKQAYPTPFMIDVIPQTADLAEKKKGQAQNFKEGVDSLPTLIDHKGQAHDLYEEAKKVIGNAPIQQQPLMGAESLDHAAFAKQREAACACIDALRMQQKKLSATLEVIHEAHDVFCRELSPRAKNSAEERTR